MIKRNPKTGKIEFSYKAKDADMFAAAKVAHKYTSNGSNPMSNQLFAHIALKNNGYKG